MGDCAACPQEEGKAECAATCRAAHQQAMMMVKTLQKRHGRQTAAGVQLSRPRLAGSLGEYSTVGALMGGLRSGELFIEGKFAKWMYWSLYKSTRLPSTVGSAPG